MTIEQISDAAKQLKKKYDETDPERLAEQMKILVSREPMGLFEGCCKGFFLVHRRKKHITINGDLPDVLQKVVLAHELGHCCLHSGSSSAAFHEVTLFDTTDQKEYEANVFASELLLSDEAVLEVLNDDMFRKQAAANSVHRERWYFSAWLDTSMVRYSSPACAAWARCRCRSRGSGVVRWDSKRSAPS